MPPTAWRTGGAELSSHAAYGLHDRLHLPRTGGFLHFAGDSVRWLCNEGLSSGASGCSSPR